MKTIAVILLLSALAFTACSQKPRPVHFGEAACEHCRMVIMDDRFVTQLVTEKGKAYLFDSIECLSSFVNSRPGLEAEAELWVGNFVESGEWMNVKEARFLRHPDINSPMGHSLLAIPEDDPGQVASSFSGADSFTWEEVKVLTQRMKIVDEDSNTSASAMSVKPDGMTTVHTHH